MKSPSSNYKTKKMSNDDPKGKKKKLFQSSESPSKAQRIAQGPAIAAAIGVGTAAAGLIAKKRKPTADKLEDLSEKQKYRSEKKAARANRIEEKRPVKAATLRAKSTVLAKKSAANKKAASSLR